MPGPWAHQAAAADFARDGRSVIISTGTASGKSLGYLLPALTAVMDGGTALYLAPTRALAADQLRTVRALGPAGGARGRARRGHPGPAAVLGPGARQLSADHSGLLHHTLLPRHARWDGFYRRLRYVIVDECHGYRGVFGSHVAQVLRRLRRIAAHHRGSGPGRPGEPVFILASATISEPQRCAQLLTGLDAEAVTADSAPRGPLTFGLWEPPLTALRGEAGAPVRRTATAEAAGLLADLVRRERPRAGLRPVQARRRGGGAGGAGARWPRPVRRT